MAGRSRGATGWGRFLLAVALFVGIVLMHALGHPGDHAAPTHAPGNHLTTTTHAAAAAVEHVVADAVHASHPDPAHGAGVAAVCVAVLGAGILLLVARRVLGRRGAETLLPTVRLAHALRAIPPPAPPRSLLTRLSLLRI